MKNRNRAMIFSYLYTGLNMISGLLLSVFLLRVLGDTDYGIYQTIAAFANYLVLLEFGTGTAMTRNISLCRGKGASTKEIQENITTIWMITLILCAVIAVVALIFYFNINNIYSSTLDAPQIEYAKNIFIFSFVHLLCSFCSQTISGIILAFEHYAFSSLVGIVRIVLRTIALISILVVCKFSLIISVVDAILSIILLIASVIYAKHHFGVDLKIGRINNKIFHFTVPLCLALFLQTIINQANNNVDKFLIGIMLSPESVALYSVGMFVFTTFSALTTIPISLYAPSINMSIQQDSSMEHLYPKLVSPCRVVAIVGGLVFFGFVAVGRSFVELFYGSKYMTAWIIAVILMLPMYFNMVTGVLINVLDALNKRMVRSIILCLVTIANVLLTVVWLKQWGIVGAAVATGICTFIGQVILMNLYYAKKLKIKVLKLYFDAFKGVLPCLVIACAASMVVGIWISNTWLSFVISILTFCLIFAGSFLFFGIQESEKNVLKAFLKGVKRSAR